MSKKRSKVNVRTIDRTHEETGIHTYKEKINLNNPDLKNLIKKGGYEALTIAWDSTRKEIASTNYFDLSSSKCGLIFLAGNKNVFHLLIPECQEQTVLEEIKTGKNCVISVCPNAREDEETFDLMFDDNSPNPYTIRLAITQAVITMGPSKDRNEQFILKVLTKGLKKVIEMPAHYRAVEKLEKLYY